MSFARKKTARTTPLTVDEVLVKLENYCAYRERCPKEVRDKIRELGLRGADADQVFDVLQADRFFEESRFARAFTTGKFRFNHWGRVRIRQELKMRDICPEQIREALDAIDPDEYLEVVEKLIAKKRQQYDGDDNARDKTIASLVRAGFELDIVLKCVLQR